MSYGLRAWTWHKYRVYIDVQALQISLLAGRVFFKGLRYHGDNETVLVHSGYVTWTYWLRNVREIKVGGPGGKATSERHTADDAASGKDRAIDGAEKAGVGDDSQLPCRITLTLNGLEWFVYNNGTAYDAVVARMKPESDGDSFSSAQRREGNGRQAHQNTFDGNNTPLQGHEVSEKRAPSYHDEDSAASDKSSLERDANAKHFHESSMGGDELHGQDAAIVGPKSFILRFLPVHIACTKAAIVIGNENTQSVLIVKADKVSGASDATTSKSPLDEYKQLFNFQFEHPVVQMKPNDDYSEDQTTTAHRVKNGGSAVTKQKNHYVHNHSFLQRQRRKVWHSLQNLVPMFRSSVDSFTSSLHRHHTPVRGGSTQMNWQGLSRYLDEHEQNGHARWSSIEYAMVTTLLDSPRAAIGFYWDVPGVVPERKLPPTLSDTTATENINGDLPPEWGVDLMVQGGLINYGPWADRQRADIQRVFFPALCKDVCPGRKLAAGEYRVATQFHLRVDFNGETTLRMPIREDSKDWNWTKEAETMTGRPTEKKRDNKGRKHKANKGHLGPGLRPFGWLDIRVAEYASVHYFMDMVPGHSSFINKLGLELPNAEITSSVNHALLWRSTENHISMDLSNPLVWNSQRNWTFAIATNDLELFLLREHVFLLTDLVEDWASGPPPEYLTFTPFRYSINFHFESFRLYLNVNDANIVNRPSDFDDNAFVTIFGSFLDADVCIPVEMYRPPQNAVSFNVEARHGGIRLQVPPWNTQATFLKSKEIGQLKRLNLRGEYHYCAIISPSNTDTLFLDIHGHGPSAQLYGFVIRYFMKIKDNYFGDDIHFKTLEEYREGLRTDAQQSPHIKANDLDVVLGITADNATAVIPSNLYSAGNHIRIDIPTLAADLRITNYYMDLDVMLHTLAFSQGSEDDSADTPQSATSSTQLYVDGFGVCGNRLFGLPPSEPTYVCNWDFDLGAVQGECSTDFLTRLVGGIRAFAFSFDDDENALPIAPGEILHDITFLRAQVESLRVWLHVDEAAILLSTATVSLNFNDWARSQYSKKLDLLIPDLCIACVDAESASRHRTRNQQPVETHAVIKSTFSLTMIEKKLNFVQDRQWQQEHVRRHDQRTHRADFLLGHHFVGHTADTVNPPAIPVPAMPFPATKDSVGGLQRSKRSSARSSMVSNTHKSSFLSIPSLGGSTSHSSSAERQTKAQKLPSLQAPERGRVLESGTRRPVLLRDLSTSTDGGSAFFSLAAGSKGLARSGITFSSSYIAPYFPLLSVDPDLGDLPNLMKDIDPQPSLETNMLDSPLGRGDESSDQVSFLVDFPGGITAALNPKAVGAVADLISALQTFDPRDILDVLQVDSMKSILRVNQQKQKRGEIMDVNIRVPQLRMRFLNPYAYGSAIADQVHDQYDLSVARSTITMRKVLKSETESDDLTDHSSAFHIALAAISVTANEKYGNIEVPQAAIRVSLRDLVLWVVKGEDTSANIVLEALETETASGKLEYLASLLDRSIKMINHLEDTLDTVGRRQRLRVQTLTYLVATDGDDATDPLFLTRPSYVLRSAPNHLRNNDSWRVITRLRHMYEALPALTQQRILSQSVIEEPTLPRDAQRQVIAAFEQWRSWDWENLSSCILWDHIYGTATAEPAMLQPMPALKVAARSGLIRIAVDPGPGQNELVWINVSAAAETKGRLVADNNRAEVVVPLVQMTVVQLYCVDTTISLNWSLCELAENIMKICQQNDAQLNANIRSTKPSARERKSVKHNVHLIVNTGKGLLAFETINVKAVTMSKGLNASVLLEVPSGSISANVMVTADAIISNVNSRSQELTLCQLLHPSVYTSLKMRRLDNVSYPDVRIAANCREISFAAKRDIPAVVQVADMIIRDEVAQLFALKQNLAEIGPSTPTSSAVKNTTSTPRFDVALILDEFQINVPLIHSLIYDISGTVARASVTAVAGSELIFNFDVKEQSHDIKTVSRNGFSMVSHLYIPPTNGRLICQSPKDEVRVSVWASVEPISLDAAAINSLLTAVNRPEIFSVVSDVKEDIKSIQDRIANQFGRRSTSEHNAERSIIYDAHLTATGLSIFAHTQAGPGSGKSTRLDFNLGTMQLLLANRGQPDKPILTFPEVHVSLSQITIELSRTGDGLMETCGNLIFAVFLTASSKFNTSGNEVRSFHLKGNNLIINLLAETASSMVDIIGHLQDKIKTLDLTKEKEYLRKLRKPKPAMPVNAELPEGIGEATSPSVMFASMYSLELLDNQVTWFVDKDSRSLASRPEKENLVLSLKRLDLSTRKENSARLTIEDLQLQMVPVTQDRSRRSPHSALLPEVIFNVGYVSVPNARRLAFQAAGKSLDLRLTSQFIPPAAELVRSIQSAIDQVRKATETWHPKPPNTTVSQGRRRPFFGKKRMESLLVDADFAGAVVHLSGRKLSSTDTAGLGPGRQQQAGKYGQFSQADASGATALRAPGLAWKIEYKDNGLDDPSLNAEVKVDASSNILYPAIVPLILEITSTIKAVVRSDEGGAKPSSIKASPPKFIHSDEENILTADPSAVLGRTRLNLGIRICQQEFSLSCQPIARVAAIARFDDIYLTINTVRSIEHGHFFAASATFSRLQASVQHVYSRESTGSFDVDSIFLSLMNSKHVSGISGVSAILKISPMKILLNVKQLQDFLLFREIWIPPEMRQSPPPQAPASTNSQSQVFLVQRYQQVAATGAFPWNATVSIAEMDVQLDLGQAIGKSAFMISNFWVSSKKTSDWEQNLCLGFKTVGMNSTGRMSGFVTLKDFKVRTSIQWPDREKALNQTPLVQGSIGFSQLRIKAAFDYQAFLIADVTSFEFVMYNVRNGPHARGDRLVAILDGEAVQVFCTTTTASQALALYQALVRLAQEKRSNYETSLKEIEKFMKRKSISQPVSSSLKTAATRTENNGKLTTSPISLHTDVIVTLKAVNIGAFPSTFSDQQVFKLEALNAQARFAVMMQSDKIHSILGLTLGQLRIGLAGVKDVGGVPRAVGEISVEDVVTSATGSRGGTILKVPKVAATMQTWQRPDSTHIDYIFKSSFEGKVEVGWNYSRISYIRGMWATHSKALAQRLGKPLRPSALKITGVPDKEDIDEKSGEQRKITAEVNVPQSKYNYTPLEPPIIETPQLRDMGEATPPLEVCVLPTDCKVPYRC